MRNCIEYVLGEKKIDSSLVYVAGPFCAEEITYEVEYAGHGADWVSSVVVEASKVILTTEPNTKYVSRRAKCSLFYVDGWGERIKSDIFITQSDNDGTVGSDILPVEVQAMASEAGFTVLDDLVVEGVIISDCDSRNMELNPMLDYNVVDSLASMRTAYMQSLDGVNGFRHWHGGRQGVTYYSFSRNELYDGFFKRCQHLSIGH